MRARNTHTHCERKSKEIYFFVYIKLLWKIFDDIWNCNAKHWNSYTVMKCFTRNVRTENENHFFLRERQSRQVCILFATNHFHLNLHNECVNLCTSSLVWYELLTRRINHIPNKSKNFDELTDHLPDVCHCESIKSTEHTERKWYVVFHFGQIPTPPPPPFVLWMCMLPIQNFWHVFRWKCARTHTHTYCFTANEFNLWNSICFLCVVRFAFVFFFCKHKIVIVVFNGPLSLSQCQCTATEHCSRGCVASTFHNSNDKLVFYFYPKAIETTAHTHTHTLSDHTIRINLVKHYLLSVILSHFIIIIEYIWLFCFCHPFWV